VLAAVAAVDAATARAAAALVEVEYEVLPPVTSPEAALAPGAPQVNPAHDNVLSHSKIRRGDADGALAASAHVVSGTWQTQRIEHLFLEPEARWPSPAPARHLASSTARARACSTIAGRCAAFLGPPRGRSSRSSWCPTAAPSAAKKTCRCRRRPRCSRHLTGRPVKLTLSREESIRMHPKRHPMTMDYTVGCDAEGG
jgi:CO/xanthine dehydrogenase Mo-binding subunit